MRYRDLLGWDVFLVWRWLCQESFADCVVDRRRDFGATMGFFVAVWIWCDIGICWVGTGVCLCVGMWCREQDSLCVVFKQGLLQLPHFS